MQLIGVGVINLALRRLGFQAELTWCQPYDFKPRLGDDRPHQVILREVRVQREPEKSLSLAQALTVCTPTVAIDDGDNTLVYWRWSGRTNRLRPTGRR
jgi:hypothetical protein